MRYKHAAPALAIALTVTALTANPAGAATKTPLIIGPYVSILCDSLAPFDSFTTITPRSSVAFSTKGPNVAATVTLKVARPNADFEALLIQGGVDAGGDCSTVDGTLHTDAKGAGRLRLSEPAVGTRAQIVVRTGQVDMTSGQAFRGADFFVIS